MNRQLKHREARESVTRRLARMGLQVTEVSRNSHYDLIINGRTRVALRVAYPGSYAHTVTVGGKKYSYDYQSWNFNFHRHGQWDRSWCDVFVCIAKNRRTTDEIYVIPASAISGPTFSLHGAGKPYRGRYAIYHNRWSIIANHANETSAAEVA